jgi:hypothetical protein
MTRTFSLLLVLALCTGCVSTSVGTNLNGMLDNDNAEFAHQETSVVALHWVFGAGGPLWEDASFENTVDEFSAAASADGRTQARISSSETSNWWWVFPPFSFIITPITSRVAGDVK